MSAEEILFKIKSEFNKNMFFQNWVIDSYELLFENPNLEVRKALAEYASKKSETEIHAIRSLYSVLNKQTGDEEIRNIEDKEKYQFENFEKLEKNKVIALPPQVEYLNERTYVDILEQRLRMMFKEFTEVTSIYGIINQACKLYDEEDNITKLTNLIKSSAKVRELVFKKKSKEYLDRALFEDNVITYYNQEMMEDLDYITICLDPEIKCLYNEVNLKLQFKSRLGDINAQKLICMLNYKDSIKDWFPFIDESKTIVVFSESKFLYYVRSLIPVIQDRELYLYGFVDNQLMESGKLTFYCRSADKNNEGEPEDIFTGIFKPSDIEEIQRIYAHCITFEINILSDKEVNLDVFIDIDHKLKFVNVQLVEVMAKQICKKICDKITEISQSETTLDKYCPKLPNELQKNFSHFYKDLTSLFYTKLNENYHSMPKVQLRPTHAIGKDNKNSKNNQDYNKNDGKNNNSSDKESNTFKNDEDKGIKDNRMVADVKDEGIYEENKDVEDEVEVKERSKRQIEDDVLEVRSLKSGK